MGGEGSCLCWEHKDDPRMTKEWTQVLERRRKFANDNEVKYMYNRFPLESVSITFFYEQLATCKNDHIDIDELRSLFNATNECGEWQKFWDEHDANPAHPTQFVKLLNMYLPNRKEEEENKPKMSKVSLICLGIFWCTGSKEERAKVLYYILQPPFKGKVQEKIAFSDDDFKDIFDALFQLVIELENFHETVDIMNDTIKKTDSEKFKYGRIFRAMRLSCHSDNDKKGIIELLFKDTENMITQEDFVDRICASRLNWVLNDDSIRDRIIDFMEDLDLLNEVDAMIDDGYA